jgi:hypothetical protein
MNKRRSIFLSASVLFLTLGLLPPMSSAVAASITSRFRPRLGCYENNDIDLRGFCLFDRGVLESYHMLTREGFDDCGKYNVRARDRIMFWWPPGAWNGALISTDIVNKPIKGTCTWRADKDDNLILSNCEMNGEWKRLSDDRRYQPSAKNCAPPSPAEAFVAAARAGDLAAMQKLLARGVDVNAKDKDGGTALMAASAQGHLDVVQALLENGADVKAKGSNGTTALSVAKDDEVKAALTDAGATP